MRAIILVFAMMVSSMAMGQVKGVFSYLDAEPQYDFNGLHVKYIENKPEKGIKSKTVYSYGDIRSDAEWIELIIEELEHLMKVNEITDDHLKLGEPLDLEEPVVGTNMVWVKDLPDGTTMSLVLFIHNEGSSVSMNVYEYK